MKGQDRKPSLETDPDGGIIDKGFKINMKNILKHLLENVANAYEPKRDFRRELEIIRRDKWKCQK